jgi:hypothetical protein
VAAGTVGIAEAKAAGLDWPAIILRAEAVVDRLRKFYGSSEWSTENEEAAASMLKYIRTHGPEDDEAGWDATLTFFEDYNVSFDWVFRGDPVTMVTGMAADSPRGTPEWYEELYKDGRPHP